MLHGTVCGIVIFECLMYMTGWFPIFSSTQPYLTMLWCWAQIDQCSIRFEAALSLYQGMDHTLVCNSSEDPGKQRYVEGGSGILDLIALLNTKRDQTLQRFRKTPARGADLIGI